MRIKKQGKYYWHNKKVLVMFILARIFGKTYTSMDVAANTTLCRFTMKFFCGKYYVIKEEWL